MPYEEARALLCAFAGQQQIVTCPRAYIDFLGDFKAAHVLNQLLFWSGKSADLEGWFYKSYREWEYEIGLSKNEVSHAIQALNRLGFVETRVRKAQGITPTVHYRLNWPGVVETLQVFLAYPAQVRQQWRRGMQRWLRSGGPPTSDYQTWLSDFQKTLSDFQKSQDFWLSEVSSTEEIQKTIAEEKHIACAQARETKEGEKIRDYDAELTDLATSLVQQFYLIFHGNTSVQPHPRELDHATALIRRHGWDFATFFVPFARRMAQDDGQRLHVFGGLLRYEASALAAYQSQARQEARHRAEQAETRDAYRRAQYEQQRADRIVAYRHTLAAEALDALKHEVRSRLEPEAAGIPRAAFEAWVNVELQERLATLADVPPFEAWLEQREAAGCPPASGARRYAKPVRHDPPGARPQTAVTAPGTTLHPATAKGAAS